MPIKSQPLRSQNILQESERKAAFLYEKELWLTSPRFWRMSGKVRDSGYPFLTNVIQLIGTLNYNYENYETYWLEFHCIELEIIISKKIPTLIVLMRMSQLREKKSTKEEDLSTMDMPFVSIVQKCVRDYVDWLNMKLTARFLINWSNEVEDCFYFIVDESW